LCNSASGVALRGGGATGARGAPGALSCALLEGPRAGRGPWPGFGLRMWKALPVPWHSSWTYGGGYRSPSLSREIFYVPLVTSRAW